MSNSWNSFRLCWRCCMHQLARPSDQNRGSGMCRHPQHVCTPYAEKSNVVGPCQENGPWTTPQRSPVGGASWRRPNLCYKDVCKRDLKSSGIDLNICENITDDRAAWKQVVQKGMRTAENSSNNVLEKERARRRSIQGQHRLPHPSLVPTVEEAVTPEWACRATEDATLFHTDCFSVLTYWLSIVTDDEVNLLWPPPQYY